MPASSRSRRAIHFPEDRAFHIWISRSTIVLLCAMIARSGLSVLADQPKNWCKDPKEGRHFRDLRLARVYNARSTGSS